MQGRLDEAKTLWNELTNMPEIANRLNGHARELLEQLPQHSELALLLAQKANELTEDAKPAILDTLALAYFVLNDFPQEREIQGGLIMLVGISIPILRTSGHSNLCLA